MEAFLRHLEMQFVMNAQREKSHPYAHFFAFIVKKNQPVPQDPINISGYIYSCIAVSSKYVNSINDWCVCISCLALRTSAVCAVEKPTQLRASVMSHRRLGILCFGYHQKETLYPVRLAECFSAGVSQHTSENLPCEESLNAHTHTSQP